MSLGVVVFFPYLRLSSHISSISSFSLPRCNSDSGSLRRLFSPLPTTVRAFIFIARRVQHFLPSSTRVELWYCSVIKRVIVGRSKPAEQQTAKRLQTTNAYHVPGIRYKTPPPYIYPCLTTNRILGTACRVLCSGFDVLSSFSLFFLLLPAAC